VAALTQARARGLLAQTDRAKHVFLCEGLFTFHIIAVSGEITLHAGNLSVQVSQSAMGGDIGSCSEPAATEKITSVAPIISLRSTSCTRRSGSPV